MNDGYFSDFARTIGYSRYHWQLSDGSRETWKGVAERVGNNVFDAVDVSPGLRRELISAITTKKFMPGGRYLAASGRPLHQTQNCLLLNAVDTREGWANHFAKATMALMTGAGIGAVYSGIRPKNAPLKRSAGFASGPMPMIHATNEIGRASLQGGSRRAAIWAGLHWNHPDNPEFVMSKNWPDYITEAKKNDWAGVPAPLDHTNISTILDTRFAEAIRNEDDPDHLSAKLAFWNTLSNACKIGDPGFSFDCYENDGEHLRNACTEITSRDDSDICNLGSINLARVETIQEFSRLVFVATAFLLAGTVYSDVPYAKVRETRTKNRRLGLGLMGIHEWLIRRGHQYGPNAELALWLSAYEQSTEIAHDLARSWDLSLPVKTRAIAPNGTISIVAETTSGLEPIFAKAFFRRWFDHGVWRGQYVVDPTTKRLVAEGIDPNSIEDSYDLAKDVGRRIDFQAWLQSYVDHGIASTINLPPWQTEYNNETTMIELGNKLLDNLTKLRGITVYPDGARGGQPLTPVSFEQALSKEGHILEATDLCDARGGSCGA